jgi:hypothetical protein
MCDVFFIIGCVRSATTAYAQILNTADNAVVYVEQEPKLLIESRELLKGDLHDPISVLRKAKDKPINSVIKRGLKYGDKNPAYMPFIPYLNEVWNSKVLFLVRDGREVVRSLMDWHQYRHPIFIMQEDCDESEISSPEEVEWDYSRVRPNPEDLVYPHWKEFHTFQKAAWHWARFNEIALQHLSTFDKSLKMIVDVNQGDIDTLRSIFNFLGLEGFNEKLISALLNERINMLPFDFENSRPFPPWSEWTEEQTREFNELSSELMYRLGYYGDS